MLTPARRRGVEILDDPNVDPAVRERSIGDVTRSNRLLGGLRAARLGVRDALNGMRDSASLLDIGAGLGDIPACAMRDANERGLALTTIAVDEALSLLIAARARVSEAVCANALALPFRDGSVDVVMCSQVLHHFENADAVRLIAEMNRVARRGALVSDLRRSRVAAVGFWLASFVLRFHPVTRHDGVVSVMRGFTGRELSKLIRSATGTTPAVSHRLGFRLTARWRPKAA